MGAQTTFSKSSFLQSVMSNCRISVRPVKDISDYKDTEVEEWRSSKRFSNYVDGFQKYVQPNNGGSFHSIARDANLLTEKYNFSKKDLSI